MPRDNVVKKYRVFAVHSVSVTVTSPATIALLTPCRMFLMLVPAPSVVVPVNTFAALSNGTLALSAESLTFPAVEMVASFESAMFSASMVFVTVPVSPVVTTFPLTFVNFAVKFPVRVSGALTVNEPPD